MLSLIEELQIVQILGKKVQIINSTNKFNANRTGFVINETKNMIFLSNGNTAGIKKVSKKEIKTIKVYSETGYYFINGNRLLGRPEERISKIK